MLGYNVSGMERRKFVMGIGSTAVVSASGCLGNISKQGQDSRGAPTEAEGGGKTSDPVQMNFSIRSVDTGPGPLSYEVDVISSVLSTTSIPSLEVMVENTGDESVNWAYAGQVGQLPLRQGVHTKSETLVIGLDEEIRSQLEGSDTGCARVDEFVSADGIKNTSLDPGQHRKQKYAIAAVAGKMSMECPDETTYRIEDELGDYGTWGFEFQLQNKS